MQSIEIGDDAGRVGQRDDVPAAPLPVAPPAAILGYVADLALEPATLLIGQETMLSGGYPLHATRLQHVQVSMVVGYGARPTCR